MKLAVLDYSTGEVDIIDNVPNLKTNEEIESYLAEALGYDPEGVHWMQVEKVNELTPEDYAVEEYVAERYRLVAQIHSQYKSYIDKHGKSPKYAMARVLFRGEDNGMDVNIKLSLANDKQDEKIFFYCQDVDDLIRLCYSDTEDFDLIELYEFTNEI